MKFLKNKIVISLIALLLIILTLWVIWGNTALELNTVKIKSDKLPESFLGYRIVHVSDLHNAVFGKENEKLVSLIESASPDIIAITGDMIDSRSTNVDVALDLAEKLVQTAPCYYVTGNHEARKNAEFKKLEKGLEGLGVTVLRNEKVYIERGDEELTLIGIDDPTFTSSVSENLSSLCQEDDGFTVLLAHRPELFEIYTENNVDLALCGHAHGGQFVLPFVGGLVAPGQGFFPKYDSGLYEKDGTNMVVSRGIGNSIIPIRFNNRPEVVLVEFERN